MKNEKLEIMDRGLGERLFKFAIDAGIKLFVKNI